MAPDSELSLLQFAEFQIDLRTRELRRERKLIRMQDLPVRLLILLATRAGELVTREEIEQELWGDDHFVDFDHGINTAMRKVREALGENPDSPRFIETLPRKGYRFIASVHRGPTNLSEASAYASVEESNVVPPPIEPSPLAAASTDEPAPLSESGSPTAWLQSESSAAVAEVEFALPSGPSRQLFLLTQAG